jgi:hypothetical protein
MKFIVYISFFSKLTLKCEQQLSITYVEKLWLYYVPQKV